MKETEIKLLKVKIIRPIRWEGKRVDVNTIMELPKHQAIELVANGKATQDLKVVKGKAKEPDPDPEK